MTAAGLGPEEQPSVSVSEAIALLSCVRGGNKGPCCGRQR